MRRFHPSRTPGTRAGPSVPPEPFSSVLAVRWPIAHVPGRPGTRGPLSSVSAVSCPWAQVFARFGRFHPPGRPGGVLTRGAVFTRFVLFRPRAVPFSPVSASHRRLHPFGALGWASRHGRAICHARARFRPFVPFGALGRTAGPPRPPGAVFCRLLKPFPSHPPKPFPSSLARFFCRPGALAICALRRPFPSSSGSRCRFQPFCAVSATRGALFIRLGLPSPSAPACGARLACFSLSWPPRAPVPFLTVSAVSCP